MSVQKRNVLGRGLAALIPSAPAPAPAVVTPVRRADTDGVRTIAIEEVHPAPDQPRTIFDDGRLEELAASIRTQGVIQPLIVRVRDGGGLLQPHATADQSA